jgi:hypothetical protein
MLRYCLILFYAVVQVTFGGCSSLPSTLSSSSPQITPLSPFQQIAGAYALTIEIDPSCAVPESLRTRTYDVLLEDRGWLSMPIRIGDPRFDHLGGEI